MPNSRAQIIGTVGPASSSKEVLSSLVFHQMDVIRFNFSWGSLAERVSQLQTIREIEKEANRKIRNIY